jgi:quercetin dioxygenase-like cupin family protein
MQRFRQDRTRAKRNAGEIFIGDVYMQDLVTDEDTPSLRVTAVTFENGARNRWHRHGSEQVLVITDGAGVVENETETYRVTPGDVVLIPAGERHWHGAEDGQSMTHLAVLLPGEMTIDDPE